MNPIRKWKKVLAVGCSHGSLIDKTAFAAICRFRESWRPDTMIHLGDWADTTAFRSGAAGNPDESEPLDIAIGLEHLEQLRCDVVLLGNHEDRIWKLAKHHNTIVRTAAEETIKRIESWVKNRVRARLVHYTGNAQAFYLGGWRYMHGTLYSENCIRDMAEAFGNVVFAHSHRPGMAKARTVRGERAFNTGWLGDVNKAGYAKCRRSTLSWGQGFVWGYYTDNASVLWLHEHDPNLTEWRLPS